MGVFPVNLIKSVMLFPLFLILAKRVTKILKIRRGYWCCNIQVAELLYTEMIQSRNYWTTIVTDMNNDINI